MWHRRRLFLPVLLILSLIAASPSVAASKGTNPATGTMTLCIGHVIVTVFTDSDGRPTQFPHFCPDCALAALSGPIPPDAGPVTLALRLVVSTQHFDRLPSLDLSGHPGQPRAPPVAAA